MGCACYRALGACGGLYVLQGFGSVCWAVRATGLWERVVGCACYRALGACGGLCVLQGVVNRANAQESVQRPQSSRANKSEGCVF